MSARLSRRALLRGGACAAAALPLLDAWQSNAQESAYPKRLILVFNPNGTIQDEFWPSGSGADFELSTILSPLQAFKDHLLILKGVDLSVTSTGPGGPHQRGMGALFTGRELQEGSFIGGDGSRAGWANGISLDQAIAEQVGHLTLLPSLELGVRATQAEVRSRISYAGPANPLPPINDPRAAYARLFAGLTGDPEELLALRAERLSVLDVVKQQFSELEQQLGQTDREKLQRHGEIIRSIERRMDLMIDTAGSCTFPEEPPLLDPNAETDMPQITQLQIDLLSAAVACDLTRVVSLQFSNAINAIRFPWLNSLGEGHALSHAGPSNTEARTDLIARATWHAEQIAYLLQSLAAIPEGDGTALDNSVVVWGNELGIGNTHTLETVPFVMAGSAGGYFKTGQFLEYSAEPHNNLLVSLLNAFGVETTTFGHPDFVTGPLSGLA